MKYYIEEETRDLRLAVEEKVLGWPKVEKRIMMGCPCYLADGKMFASLVSSGIVITKLNEKEMKELDAITSVKPFNTGSRLIKRWARINASTELLDKIISFLKASYHRALEEAKSKH